MTPKSTGNAPADSRPSAAVNFNSANRYSPIEISEYAETRQNRSGFCALIAFLAIVAGSLLASQKAHAKCRTDVLSADVVMHTAVGTTELISVDQLLRGQTGFNNTAFREFVERVMTQLTATMVKSFGCAKSGMPKTAEVHFVYVPLDASSFEPDDLEDRLPTKSQCRVVSPWLQLEYQSQASPRVSSIFIWNERQVLLDQANLTDATSRTPSTLPIFTTSVEYLRQIFLDQSKAAKYGNRGTLPAADLIPPDFLWLFRRIARDNPGGLDADAYIATLELMAQASARQADLAVKLASLCLDDSKGMHALKTIQDVRDVVNLNDYKF